MSRILIVITYVLTLAQAASMADEKKMDESVAGDVAKSKEKSAAKATRPLCILVLSKAEKFFGPTPGESGYSSVQLAYKEASANALSLEKEDLDWLLKNPNPAARVYGSILLFQSSKVGQDQSLGQLQNDRMKLDYQDGCKVVSSTVGEMTRSLMETGRYLNFQLGGPSCKLKAPSATDKDSGTAHN